jgi:beta-hydroxyacyl-ACP dehydratase FabZ
VSEPKYDVKEIMTFLPHRYPFLMVDRVLEIREGYVSGIKNVTANEPMFQGHFPGQPIFPGILQVEALAQLGGIYMFSGELAAHKGKVVYFVGIDGVRFSRLVVPGDQLLLELDVKRYRPGKEPILVMGGKTSVNGEVACTVDRMMAILKAREK